MKLFNCLLFLTISFNLNAQIKVSDTGATMAALRKSAATLSDQPFASAWFPSTILQWSPASDPDSDFNRSFTPLAERFFNTDAMVNDHARPNEAKISALDIFAATSGNPSQGSLEIDYFAFNYWQYIDLLVFWGGSAGEGLILAPNPGVIDAAHRNGVPVYGTVFFPPNVFGGNIQWVRDFLQKDGDSFPVADKLIEVAEYYGFDGWFINQETKGANASLASDMVDWLKYYQANSTIEIMWYDAMTENGGVNWQNALTSSNDRFLQDGPDLVSETMFLNFWWNSAGLDNSRTLARNLGRSEYELHAGVDVQANGFNTNVNWPAVFPENQAHVMSLSFFVPSWTFHSSQDNEDFYQRANRFWVGANGDPAMTETNESWKGLAHYVPAKSVINSLPFSTNFSTGQGNAFYRNGTRVSHDDWTSDGWNNMSLQDVLPTWRWVVEGDGSTLKPQMDWSDAYYGGNCIRFSGGLTADTRIKLFQTSLDISAATKLEIAHKRGQTGSTGMKVGLAFEGDLANVTYYDVPDATSEGWNLATIDIGDNAGRTVAIISLLFESTTDGDYSMKVGRLGIYEEAISSPASPSNLSIVNRIDEDAFSTMRLKWQSSASEVNYYSVYKRNQDGSRTYLGGTANNAYFVPWIKREVGDSLVTVEVEAVGLDFGASQPAATSFVWYGPPGLVTNPFPGDQTTNVSRNTELRWQARLSAESYDVYFGTNPTPEFAGNQVETEFQPGVLEPNTTYYWRIDPRNDVGPATGVVWSFTTGALLQDLTGSALDFDGDNDFVNCGNAAALRLGGQTLTLEAWIFVDQFKDQVWQGVILAKDSGGSPGLDFGYMLRAGANGQLNVNIGNGSWNEFNSPENVIIEGAWTHVAATYDGANFRQYVNGEEVGVSGNVNIQIGNAVTANFLIGDSPAFPGRVFDGKIDEVRVWRVARSQAQIQGTMRSQLDETYTTSADSGLVGYWPITRDAGQTVENHAFGGADAILGGTVDEDDNDPVWSDSDALKIFPDVALRFDGSQTHVNVGNPESLRLTGDQITIEAWIRPNRFKDAVWAGVILSKEQGGSPGSDFGYMLRAGASGQLNINIGDGRWHELDSPANALRENEWSHVAGTYDGNNLRLFVDGELVATSGSSSFSIGDTPDADFLIGESSAFPGRVFDGDIDEIRLWNVARSESQIKKTMNDQLGAKYWVSADSGLVGYWPVRQGEGQLLDDLSVNDNPGTLGSTTGDDANDPIWIDSQRLITSVAAQQFNDAVPAGFVLHQNYPNPFNPSTTIEFEISKRVHVLAVVFNLKGQRVAKLLDERMPAGSHTLVWNGRDGRNRPLASGVYFYQIRAGNFFETRKLTLLK